eukprot:g31875.t1
MEDPIVTKNAIRLKTKKPSLLEFLGLAGNFHHLNIRDPFDVKKRGSTITTEIRAGITTFLAMAYILPVNSGMLSLVMPDKREQLVCATALAAFCGCWLMGIMSNYPFMLAPGRLESIGAGVGLFLTFIAFQTSEGMGLSVGDKATLVTLNSLSSSNYDAAKLWLSIAEPWPLCWIEGFARGEEHSVFGYPFGTDGDRSNPDFKIYVPTSMFASPSLSGLSGSLWSGFAAASDPALAATFWTAVGTFCYTDLLDSSGTFFAVAKERTKIRENMAYLADALAALIGSMLGVSTVATFAESTAGVADGAKTGLASLVTGACFLLAIPIAPVVSAVPPLASGPILCLLGALMCSSVRGIDWDDYEEPSLSTVHVGIHGDGHGDRGPETDVKLRLAHAFGVYPSPIKDAVISLGEDTFAFCVGRHVALCHQHRQRLSFLGRDARHRIITAMTKSHNGKFLAIGERVGSEDGSNQHAAQISVVGVSKADLLGETKDFKDETLKVLHPSNKRLDIIGLAFTGDGKHLISVSSMPDATVSFWRWDVEKLMSSHDMQTPVNRVLVNPSNVTQFSVGGHAYLRLWDFNPNDQGLTENPSLFPLKQEKQMKVVDHCWALSIFLCAASEDGHIHIFQDGELAVEKEQARQLANLMGEAGPGTADAPPVRITTITAWFQGFVVGGDQGYLGVFRIDAKAQVDSVGTFRMPGEKAERASSARTGKAGPQSTRSRASSANTGGRMRPMGAKWSLHTFPMAQADLVGTGQLEVFTPVFRFGAHHGSVTSLKPAFSRRMVASCAEDRSLKLWSFPTEEQEAQAMSLPFSAELSLQVSSYECASALAVHPLGFQIAAILEDSTDRRKKKSGVDGSVTGRLGEDIVRIYHLTPIQATRTQFDLPLKNPGGVAYSNGGSLLAVSSENDVALIDPWRAVVIHLFSGRGGGHDDRWLLSSGTAPHGAIYGWDLSTPARERCFEHVCKHSTYTDFSFDARQGLVVACREPEGHLRVIGHLSSPQYEIQPENKQSAFTCQCLAWPLERAAALGLLLAGTRQGSVRIYRWPFQVGSAALTEISLHAHSITAMTLTLDARYLFTGCEGGAVLCCEVAQSTLDSEGDLLPISATEIEQQIVRFRHGENEKPVSSKAQREDDRKALELQEKLWEAVKAISASTAKLDDLQMIPKTYLSDVLSEIRALEDRMLGALEAMKGLSEQELQDKLISIQMEQRSQKSLADEKYDNLFMQLKQSTERHEKEMQEANTHFDHRHKKMQDELEGTISKEYEKNSKLLDELQSLRDEFEGEKTKMLKSHDEQLLELRSAQERALRDWRTEYDKVCSLLKSDGLNQIVEIKERERRALQDESEKAATALKDGDGG